MSEAPLKPRLGQPCNGCGMCCTLERCGVAVEVNGPGPGPCEFLSWESGRAWCRIVVAEQEGGHEPLVAEALGIGKGCCGEDPLPATLPQLERG